MFYSFNNEYHITTNIACLKVQSNVNILLIFQEAKVLSVWYLLNNFSYLGIFAKLLNKINIHINSTILKEYLERIGYIIFSSIYIPKQKVQISID